MKEWPEVTIYQNDISPHCRTVLMVIKELGLNVTFREVNLDKEEHLSEEFLKMNPLHTIPVMEECGYVLTDSHAIACFIIDDLSYFDYSLYPKDLQVRALVNQYLMIEAATLFPLVKHTIIPIMLGQKSSISKEMLDGCKEAYSCLDKLLEGKKWLVGDSYTLADINCVTVASSISPVAERTSRGLHLRIIHLRK
ncbi:glutathione S-transferase 1-like isoform X6 [Bombus affinis]|uniref:glutathione S-transferase 1-like isoform X6 n=1 Tax=Bombus affinis TaxID=309941 RepID=UPI0021B71CE9|nr:glutathione S-transferase 1-like isoform X6 [Bombus affinis]